MLTVDTCWKLGDVEKARQAYTAIRDTWIGGGNLLEAHERIGLLTVAAGLRPFSFLNHLERGLWDSVAAALGAIGVKCAPCVVNFDYQLDADVPDNAKEAYQNHQLRCPFLGLGIWRAAAIRASLGLAALGTALHYPQCCSDMDCRAKTRDHAGALQSLYEDVDGDIAALEHALASGFALPWSDEQEDWGKRLELTRAEFPFAVHTACDECLRAGRESPTAALSRTYEQLVLAASTELHLMVRWACEVCGPRSVG